MTNKKTKSKINNPTDKEKDPFRGILEALYVIDRIVEREKTRAIVAASGKDPNMVVDGDDTIN